MTRAIFHLAYHVHDLDAAREFYGTALGCAEGRSTANWVDFDFFGHQISLHLGEPFATSDTGRVAEHMVPMPHLGIILPMVEFDALKARLMNAGTEFVIEPFLRYPGEPGEQAVMFLRDPSGNPIEIKGFADFDGIFAT